MIYSKNIIDGVVNFFLTNKNSVGADDNMQTAINTIGAQYGVPITPIKWFSAVNPTDQVFPAAVLYEEPASYRLETLNTYIKQYNFVLMFADQEADIEQTRINLYAYRDAANYLLEKYYDLSGLVDQNKIISLEPAQMWATTGSYNGYINIKFSVDCIN